MALIAEYLLHLAANPNAAKLHNRSTESAQDLMLAFGLDEKQRLVIATGDRQKISEALARELPIAPEPGKTMTFEFCGGIMPHPLAPAPPEPPPPPGGE